MASRKDRLRTLILRRRAIGFRDPDESKLDTGGSQPQTIAGGESRLSFDAFVVQEGAVAAVIFDENSIFEPVDAAVRTRDTRRRAGKPCEIYAGGVVRDPETEDEGLRGDGMSESVTKNVRGGGLVFRATADGTRRVFCLGGGASER
jgi:hypothetical protein